MTSSLHEALAMADCLVACPSPLAFSSLPSRRSLLLACLASSSCPPFTNALLQSAHFQLEPIKKDNEYPPTVVLAPHRRILAIGDLHGDLDQSRRALRLAGLLSSDGQDRWVGGNAVLVQVGDILDRGGDEIAIMSLLHWLNLQAQLKGGAVFQVNGNHETMNVEGDFRYVDPTGFYEADNFVEFCEEEFCGDWEAAFSKWRIVSEKRKAAKSVSYNWMPWNLLKMQKGMAARNFLFRPGGPLALELSKHGVVLKVNDWLFVHGGIHPHHVAYGLERINKEVSQWMTGTDSLGKPVQMPFVATRGFDSVVWSRLYSRETFEKPEDGFRACSMLKSALDAAGAKGMVVGHTPQTLGANSKCQGQIWRIDVGMSRGMLNAKPEVLEIFNEDVRVLNATSQGTYFTDEMPGLTKDKRQFTTI